jgi:hypothetical protein
MVQVVMAGRRPVAGQRDCRAGNRGKLKSVQRVDKIYLAGKDSASKEQLPTTSVDGGRVLVFLL